MQIIQSSGRCYITPFKEGADVKSKSGQEGIGSYGNWCGWFLSWFGYADQIKGDQDHAFYINVKSAIHWIKNHGETFDEACDTIQSKLEAVAKKALKKEEKITPPKQQQKETNPVVEQPKTQETPPIVEKQAQLPQQVEPTKVVDPFEGVDPLSWKSLSDDQLTDLINKIVSTSQNPCKYLSQLLHVHDNRKHILDVALPLLKDADGDSLQLLTANVGIDIVYEKLSLDQLARIVKAYEAVENAYIKIISNIDLSTIISVIQKVPEKIEGQKKHLLGDAHFDAFMAIKGDKITLKDLSNTLKMNERKASLFFYDILSKFRTHPNQDLVKPLHDLESKIDSSIATELNKTPDEIILFNLSTITYRIIIRKTLDKCHDKESCLAIVKLLSSPFMEIDPTQLTPPLCGKYLAIKTFSELQSKDKNLSLLDFGKPNYNDPRDTYAKTLVPLCRPEDAKALLQHFKYNQGLAKIFLEQILASKDTAKITSFFAFFWSDWSYDPAKKDQLFMRYGYSPLIDYQQSGSNTSQELLYFIESAEVLKAVWEAVPTDVDENIKKGLLSLKNGEKHVQTLETNTKLKRSKILMLLFSCSSQNSRLSDDALGKGLGLEVATWTNKDDGDGGRKRNPKLDHFKNVQGKSAWFWLPLDCFDNPF